MPNRRLTAEQALQKLQQLRDEDSDNTDSDIESDIPVSDTETDSNDSSSTDDEEIAEPAEDDELAGPAGDDEVAGPVIFDLATGPATANHLMSRDGTHWYQEPLRNPNVRTATENIIRLEGGPTQYILQRTDTISDIFIELFDSRNMDDIVKYTNAEAATHGQNNFNLDVIELKAFIGLCLARGVTKGRNEPVSSFWSEETGRAMFKETMTRNRFQSIMRFLRFDDKNNRRQRRQQDRFSLIRIVWDRFMSNCSKSYRSHSCVTVDEQLLSCRSRCGFIQYMPTKPGKFGIKFWLCSDSSSYYVLDGYPYVGRDPERVQTGLGEHTVLKLVSNLKSGINVTTDNFFTSQSLAKKLQQQNKTLVGTLRANRKEIPQDMTEFGKTASLHESKFYYSETTTLLGYKAKRNKSVLLLSSMHKSGHVLDTGKRTPEMIQFYNETKIGVDKADEMLKAYSTKSGSRRWPIHVFANIMDICGLNAYIIASETQLFTSSRRAFLLSLSKKLCEDHKARHLLVLPLERYQAVGEEELPRRTTCRRCHSNKTKQKCAVCNIYCCGTCSSQVCVACFPK